MKKTLLCFATVFILCTLRPSEGVEGTKPDKKIRGTYWGLQSAEQAEPQLRLLNHHGLNAALLKDGHWEIRRDLWHIWATTAQAWKIRVFPVLNFAGPAEVARLQDQYASFVDRRGTRFQKTPCPMDALYWKAAITTRFERLAQLAGIAGLLFDTEMYGGPLSSYQEHCFCDECWQRFFLEQEQTVPSVSPEHRYAYLTQHHLLQSYGEDQNARLEGLLRKIEISIHRINPQLSLGFLGFRQNWFYTSLARGLGTNQRPVLIFSESSYIKGFTPQILQEHATITVPQISAKHIPGLWLGRFFPKDLPSQLLNLAYATDGYWLFSASSLWASKPLPEPYALHGTPSAYWTAIHQANKDLSSLVEKGDKPGKTPPHLPFSSYQDPSGQHLYTTPALHAMLQTLPPPDAIRQQDTLILYRGTTLFHGVPQPEGAIRIRPVPIGKYTDLITYELFDHQGNRVQSDHITSSTSLALPKKVSERFSLVVHSGANAVEVSFLNLPFLVEASPTFPFATINTKHRYQFYVHEKRPRLTLRAYCSSPEAASVRIQSPDAALVKTTPIEGFTEISLPLAEHQQTSPEPWTLTVDSKPPSAFEDIKLYFYNEKYPYMLTYETSANGLKQ